MNRQTARSDIEQYNKDRWRRGVVVNVSVVINEVTLRRARLILGGVTVCGRVNHLGM